MKTFNLILFLLVITGALAQAPENPEDISPLLIGEKLPEAQLLDKNGNSISLENLLKEKPTVLVFYRGGWCPYCNSQLSGLAEIEKEVIALGYQIIAISPDNYKMLSNTIEKDEVAYQLYADPDARLIQALGIGFKTPEGNKKYIFNKTNFEPTEILPVPTVMVVNKKGEILFEYINPNFKERLNENLLLGVLKSL